MVQKSKNALYKAAVCPLDKAQDDTWMRQVAQEMNLSETAFLLPQDDGFSLRWFTPTTEVDLCGHATLASAHVLWETGILAAGESARFYTRSGLLTAVGAPRSHILPSSNSTSPPWARHPPTLHPNSWPPWA